MTQSTGSDYLDMVVIYHNPRDAPGKYVARRWRIEGGPNYQPVADAEPICVDASLEKVRQVVAEGRFRLDRHELDDPVILEVWL